MSENRNFEYRIRRGPNAEWWNVEYRPVESAGQWEIDPPSLRTRAEAHQRIAELKRR